MFGERPRLDPLELRKQLLIAESELNRAQLSQERQTMALEVGNLTHWAKTVGAWVSSAVLLAAGLAAMRKGASGPRVSERSWFKQLLHGARVASTIWFALRGDGHKPRRP